MDAIGNRDNVFSRGPSPPSSQQPFQAPSSQMKDPHVSPAPSHREIATSVSNNPLDSLFQGLNSSSASHVSPQPNTSSGIIYSSPQEQSTSGPATPASVNAGSVSSSGSGPSNQAAERQNALLSLLGAVSGPSASPPSSQIGASVTPQQVPTPPGSAPRNNPSNESQGKLLLGQLMSG